MWGGLADDIFIDNFTKLSSCELILHAQLKDNCFFLERTVVSTVIRN